MCRNAHPAGHAANSPGVFDGKVLLADVDARRTCENCNIRPVIQDEPHTERRQKIAEHASGCAKIGRRRSFVAELNQLHSVIGKLFRDSERWLTNETWVKDSVE
jgi:hypothetical protein